MRLGSMTVGVGTDLTDLDKGLDQAKGKALAAGQGMAQAIGDGLSRVQGYLGSLEKTTEDFVTRNKGKLATLAAAAAGVWAYNHPDEAKRYYNQAVDAAGQAADSIRNGFSTAYADISSSTGDFASKAQTSMNRMGQSVAQTMGDIANRFGQSGQEAGKYFTSKFLEGVGDIALKLGEKAVAMGAEMERMSQYGGLSVQTLSQLQSVSDQTGVSLESLAGRFQALNAATTGQSDAAKLARAQLEAIGISVTDANGNVKTAGQLWVELSEATRGWSANGEDATKRLGILQNILGSMDKDTLALLNEGGATNQARLAEAARLSTIFTDQMAEDMRRIQAERKAEAAEEKAWAERKALLWAGLGKDFTQLAHDVEWGQKSFVDAIADAWNRIGTFVTDWIDFLKEKYQGFLVFMQNGLSKLSPDLVPDWLKEAVKNGPGPKAVVPSLSGRNPDGSPQPQGTPPGSIKPPTPLSPPDSKSSKDSELELKKFIDSISGSAMSEQASMLGDKYLGKDLSAWKDYTAEINELNKKLENYSGANKDAMEKAGWYWATYRLGIKLAGNEIEHARDVLNSFGASQAKLGDLIGDPSLMVEGKLKQLSVNFAKEYDGIANDSKRTEEEKAEEITTLYRRAAEERFQIENGALGDLAKLDDGYISRKMQGIDLYVNHLKQRGVDEHTITVAASKKLDDLNKQTLDARIGYEENFGDYLKDRLSQNYGLYKTSYGQMLDTWQKTADAIIKGLDGIVDVFSWTFGQVFGDLLTGKFKGVENYVQQLLAQLKQAFASFLTDLTKIAIRQYVVIPIVGQIVGTEGSFGLEGVSGLNVKGGDGFSLQNAAKYGGYAKDAYSLFGGGSGAFSNVVAGDTLIKTASGQLVSVPSSEVSSTLALNPGATTAGATPGGGVMSVAGPALAAGGLSYMGGQFFRPDTQVPGVVGGVLGAGTAAALSSSTVMGAAGMTAFGALSATGIGALVGIGAAAIAALATPESKKSEWTTPAGSKPAIMLAGGELVPSSYGVIKTTTSGMFGSSSTSHSTIYQGADAQMAAQEKAALEAATAGLTSFSKQLGYTKQDLSNSLKDLNFPAIAIPDGQEAAVYKNIANLQAETFLTSQGLKEEMDGLLKDGEYYIDAMQRLSSTMDSMAAIAQAAGVDMDQFTKGMDRLVAADYVSRLADAAGGMDALSAAMVRLGRYGYNTQEQLQNSLTATAVEAAKSIADIGDMSVTLDNFWAKFRAAMEAGMPVDQMAAWATASQRMEAWEQSRTAALQLESQTIQDNISALQAQVSAIQEVQQKWAGLEEQMLKLRDSLLQNSSLSPLSPEEKMNQAKSRMDAVVAAARSGDQAQFGNVDQYVNAYLGAASAYWGTGSTQYDALFQDTLGSIDDLKTYAQGQADTAQQQLDALNAQIAQLTAQSDQLNTQIAQNDAQTAALGTINTSVGGVTVAVNNMASVVSGAISQAESMAQAALSMASLPHFATGGWAGPGYFVAGDDPRDSTSGEVLWSATPVKVFNNTQSRKLLGRGNAPAPSGSSDVEGRLDRLGRVLVAIHDVLVDGGGAGAKLDDIRLAMRSASLVEAGR